MTWDEAIKKYGDVQMKFASYFKYTFTYSGTLDDGTPISCTCGGDGCDIYRYSVEADTPEPLRSVASQSICVGTTEHPNYAYVTNPNS